MSLFKAEIRIPVTIEADDIVAAKRYANAVSVTEWEAKLPPVIEAKRPADDISGAREIAVTGTPSLSFLGLREKKAVGK